MDLTMQPTEALSTAALVSVTVAGFTGVVAVFGGGPLHKWPQVDRFRLRMLLSFSLLPLAFCLFALLLQATEIPPPVVWRSSSGLAAAILLTVGSWNLYRFSRFPANELRESGASKVVFYASSSIGFAFTALLIVNAVALGTFWPLFAAIVVALLGSTLQFARLVLSPPAGR